MNNRSVIADIIKAKFKGRKQWSAKSKQILINVTAHMNHAVEKVYVATVSRII